MSIDFEKFVDWAEKRFGDVVVKGDEVKVNSIFTDDYKHHLWCNPKGGKVDAPYGVYHCWKTDRGGSLVSLVMQVDKCSFDDALDILGGADISFAELEKKVSDFFDSLNKSPEVVEEPPSPQKKLELPPFTYPILELPSYHFYRIQSEVYLYNRKIPLEGLMVCTGGEFRNRIIIPYYDRDGNLIYWNSRILSDRQKGPKYKGPQKEEVGVGKDDVLYLPEWPPIGSKIYLVEGEFDAISIRQTNLFSGAFGGKNLSESQIEYLRDYKIVLSLDVDSAGKEALGEMSEELATAGVTGFSFVCPPKQYKDWNKMLEKVGPRILGAYLINQEQQYASVVGEPWTANWEKIGSGSKKKKW